ncbi:hypothetical protein [Bacillus sp. FJAT-45350]|nr:hypothetical protein [Bacillus sp. FJAT-45350]
MKKHQKKEITIETISYVHDPDAAKQWFETYMEIVKKELLEQISKDKD